MAESSIERYLRTRVERMGGLCWKWVSPGRVGVPDRIVMLKGGVIAFVELKNSGKSERPSQIVCQNRMKRMGCWVFSSVDSKEKVDSLLASMTIEQIRRGQKP